MSVGIAVNILWFVWYVTWIAAVIWSDKTKVQMKTDMGGLHRILSNIGFLLLFVPSNALPPTWGVFALLSRTVWNEPDWLAWSLFALVAASFGFCWWARRHLGRLWSGFVTLKEGHRMVDTGPYGLVRHPIYSGVMAAALATALIRASPMALAGFVLIVVGFAMTARIEERFLREQLGAEAYDDYRRRVPMLVPAMR
jgi:protein-S-isoprenylcysteine O-methyltransferase Ste14